MLLRYVVSGGLTHPARKVQVAYQPCKSFSRLRHIARVYGNTTAISQQHSI